MPHLAIVDSASLELSNDGRRIAVVGTGYVGLVTGACLAQLGNTVACLDKNSLKIAALQRDEVPFFEPRLGELILRNHHVGRLSFSEDIATGVRNSEIVFVAVGTPIGEDGNADLSAVREVATTIGRHLNAPKIVVLKSTVPVGTSELVAEIIAQTSESRHAVEVVSNPEFLREGSAVDDFMQPDRVVIGASNPNALGVIRDLYAPLGAPFVIADLRTSEMIKYAANAFLATKISFINEIANICEHVEIDVKTVSLGMALDPRIGAHNMNPGIGYGGSCFPKDVPALEKMAEGYDARLLRSVDAINHGQVSRAFAKVEKALGGSVEGKVVGVLGLAFKPNTSDVREAPAIRLIEMLVRCGATVVAHDPVAIESARASVGFGVTYCSQLYEAVNDCDVLVLATEWEEYRSINFRMVKKLMRGDVVLDGRNLFDADKVTSAGLSYVGVGRARQATLDSMVALNAQAPEEARAAEAL